MRLARKRKKNPDLLFLLWERNPFSRKKRRALKPYQERREAAKAVAEYHAKAFAAKAETHRSRNAAKQAERRMLITKRRDKAATPANPSES